jgi:FtsP/CotA-like multicopper oxidase with cupredoxin domain
VDTTDGLLGRITHDLTVSEDAMRSIPEDTGAQAIADGVLVAVEEGIAREAGFRVPVAITRAAWEDCVAWTDADSELQTHQDESERLRDVLFMTAQAARRYRNASRMTVELYRVPKDGRTLAPKLTQLLCTIGPGDTGEPVITLMMPNQD